MARTPALPRSRRLRLLPAILYMAVIFYVSSIPGPQLPVPAGADDRLFHFAEYFGLGLALMYGATAFRTGSLRPVHYVAVAITGILYGISDELHQSFVPQRDASVRDLIFDVAGVVAALVIAALIQMRRRV